MQNWKVRLVNVKALLDGANFNHRDENGKFDVIFNEVFPGKTPREARKLARVKYPLNKGWRLGFTKKCRKPA